MNVSRNYLKFTRARIAHCGAGGQSALDGKHWPADLFVDYVRVWQASDPSAAMQSRRILSAISLGVSLGDFSRRFLSAMISRYSPQELVYFIMFEE